jgi:hypothetical protein
MHWDGCRVEVWTGCGGSVRRLLVKLQVVGYSEVVGRADDYSLIKLMRLKFECGKSRVCDRG